MKDNQEEIFQALIVALFQQTEPLPAGVQSKFNQIDENYTTSDILRLTTLHPPLEAAYKTNRVWLKNHSRQRSKGPLPNAEFETNNPTNATIENIDSNISDLPDLQQIYDRMNAKVQPHGFKAFLIKISKATDSVKASRDTILVSIADGFVHE
ncbi:MAG: hypothetical protein HC894_25495 [Microcoleus sp. SM1_3_4]|nr:hypothetical protein [Microcoleus sp. SM1_3_4]